MAMNEEEIKTKETLNQYLQDWGILLEEQMNIALDTNWGQKFLWDTAVSWECFADEVNRIEHCITLHDDLVTIDSDFLMFALTLDFKWIPLHYFDKEVLEEWKKIIDDELAKDREY